MLTVNDKQQLAEACYYIDQHNDLQHMTCIVRFFRDLFTNLGLCLSAKDFCADSFSDERLSKLNVSNTITLGMSEKLKTIVEKIKVVKQKCLPAVVHTPHVPLNVTAPAVAFKLATPQQFTPETQKPAEEPFAWLAKTVMQAEKKEKEEETALAELEKVEDAEEREELYKNLSKSPHNITGDEVYLLQRIKMRFRKDGDYRLPQKRLRSSWSDFDTTFLQIIRNNPNIVNQKENRSKELYAIARKSVNQKGEGEAVFPIRVKVGKGKTIFKVTAYKSATIFCIKQMIYVRHNYKPNQYTLSYKDTPLLVDKRLSDYTFDDPNNIVIQLNEMGSGLTF